MMSKHLYGAVLMGAIVIPATLEGCSSSTNNPLCCTEFKPGATVDANIGGSVKSKVAVQAVADFSGTVSAAVEDLSTACGNIANDLGADPTAVQAANAKTGSDRMNALCALAVSAIGTAKAGLTLTIDAKAPACSVDVQAKASCQGSCQVNAPKCDFKANPPVCTGGTLQVDCKGNCTAKAGATLDCTGTCTGNCTGSCTAQGGVRCAGKCDGTCTADGSANGQAFDAQGNCQGTCKGTCSVTPPGVKCSGSCQGKCDATCQGSATASVKCDGTCDADYQPVSCQGGTLSGGCTPPDAHCEANCDASVRAKAQCTPPGVTVTFSGSGDANVIAKLKATLEANLGVVLEFKSRLSAMADISANFAGNFSAVTDIKAACIPVVAGTITSSVSDLTASVTVTGQLLGSVGAS